MTDKIVPPYSNGKVDFDPEDEVDRRIQEEFGPRSKRSEPTHNAEPLRNILDDLSNTASRFLYLQTGAADVYALWTVFAHTMDWHRHNPALLLWSRHYGSGKSTAMEMLSHLLPKAKHVSNTTEAAIFRRLDEGYGLLLEETDAWKPEVRNSVKSILNGAHSRGGSFVERADLDNQRKVKAYSTWRPLAFASKARELSDGQVRRSIKIVMEKARPGQLRDRWDTLMHRPLLHELHDRIKEWVAAAKVDPADTFPEMPADVPHPDTWRPLFVLADMAGGDWPERVRMAAKTAPKQEDDEGVRLLRDMKAIFDAGRKARLHTFVILHRLHEGEWGEMQNNRPLTEHKLRKMLKVFDVGPLDEAFGPDRKRGYAREDFEEAWRQIGL